MLGDEFFARLLQDVEQTKKTHGFAGFGSDAKALRILIGAWAGQERKSVAQALSGDLPRLQKRLSQARRKFPGNRT